MKHELILQLHGGGSSTTTTTQTYTPTEGEKRLHKLSADYAEAVMPNAYYLNDTAKDILKGSIGSVQYDFGAANDAAQAQIAAAQQGVASLANGELPAAYQQNMENSIRSGVQNTMGTQLNSLANRGVLNSSVTSKAMDDISKNASDAMAQQYSNNISTLNGLYGQQATLANSGMTTAAAAQEAAQQPALNLWNASLGLGGQSSAAAQAISGTGTTTSTNTTTNSGGGLFGGLLSTAGSVFCFVGDTRVTMADNTTKEIRNIEVGDRVKAYNEETKKFEDVKVAKVIKQKLSDVYKVGTNLGISVITTLSQPLLTTHGGWVLVQDLTVGTPLLRVGLVTEIRKLNSKEMVYDLKLERINTYIANGFIAKGGE